MSIMTFSNEFFGSLFETIATGCEFEQPYTDPNKDCCTVQYFSEFFGSLARFPCKRTEVHRVVLFFQSENNRAYNERYNETGVNFFPLTESELKNSKRLSVVHVIKSMQCLLYNLPDYEEKPVEVVMAEKLISKLCQMIVMNSELYNATPWGE